MSLSCRVTGPATLALVAALIPAGPAAATDLHSFWDSRCASCHRHAGDFARNHLKLKDGRLLGRSSSRNICEYLIGHGAGFAMAKPLCEMLVAQTATPSLFKTKCASCHDTAAALARTSLVKGGDGVLMGRQNGKAVAGYLEQGHGGLTASELATVVGALTRVLGEVEAMPPAAD